MLLVLALVLDAWAFTFWLVRYLDRDPSEQDAVYPCCWATVGGLHFLSCDTVSPAEAAARIAAPQPPPPTGDTEMRP